MEKSIYRLMLADLFKCHHFSAFFPEALLIFNPSLEIGSDHLQKQTLQLLSKMRYLSSQYIPFFKDALWRTLALRFDETN